VTKVESSDVIVVGSYNDIKHCQCVNVASFMMLQKTNVHPCCQETEA
jgi:hypothetical protein